MIVRAQAGAPSPCTHGNAFCAQVACSRACTTSEGTQPLHLALSALQQSMNVLMIYAQVPAHILKLPGFALSYRFACAQTLGAKVQSQERESPSLSKYHEGKVNGAAATVLGSVQQAML